MKILLTSLAVVTVCVCQADSLRSQIVSTNNMIGAAMKKKDFVGMDKVFRASVTPDFTYVEVAMPGKPQTYDQMFNNMKGGLSAFTKVTTVSDKVLTVKEMGSTGSAVTIYTMGGTIMGQDKKAHTMMSSGKSTETYVKVGGKWKLKKMSWSDNKMTMDGKPMDPSKM